MYISIKSQFSYNHFIKYFVKFYKIPHHSTSVSGKKGGALYACRIIYENNSGTCFVCIRCTKCDPSAECQLLSLKIVSSDRKFL